MAHKYTENTFWAMTYNHKTLSSLKIKVLEKKSEQNIVEKSKPSFSNTFHLPSLTLVQLQVSFF